MCAATGMDALTHAIEGYITKAAWELTDMMHLKAIEIIAQNLRAVCRRRPEGHGRTWRVGQYIAGMGFSNVGLGIVHSMAHPLSALYDTPHGVACASILPDRAGIQCGGDRATTLPRNRRVPMGVKGT